MCCARARMRERMLAFVCAHSRARARFYSQTCSACAAHGTFARAQAPTADYCYCMRLVLVADVRTDAQQVDDIRWRTLPQHRHRHHHRERSKRSRAGRPFFFACTYANIRLSAVRCKVWRLSVRRCAVRAFHDTFSSLSSRVCVCVC